MTTITRSYAPPAEPALDGADQAVPPAPTGPRRGRRPGRAALIASGIFVVVGITAIALGVEPVAALTSAALLAVAVHTALQPPLLLRRALSVAVGTETGWRLPLVWLPRVAVAATALWIVLLMALNPAGDVSRYGPGMGAGYTPTLVASLVLLFLLCLPAYWRLSTRLGGRWDRTRLRRRLVIAIPIAVAVIAVQFVVAIGTSKTPGFDAGGIITSSWQHADSPTGMFIDPSDYYSLLPNNAFLGYAFYLGFLALRLVGITSPFQCLTAAILVNALVLTIGAWLTVVVARRLGGTPVALFVLPALLLFVVLSPWLNTPYSDTLGLLFPIAALYCFLRFRGATRTRPRAGWLVTIGLLAAVGGALKPTVLLPIALIVIAMLIERPPSLRRRTLGDLGLVAIGGATYAVVHVLILAGIGASGLVHFDVFHDTNALPFTHLMVYGSQGYGGYDQAVAERSIALPADERFAQNLSYYTANVSAMHWWGYLAFLGNKALWILGDGSFFQGREGDTPTGWYFSDPVSSVVQSFFPLGTPGHAALASLWQAGWIVLLACVALWLVVRPRGRIRTPVVIVQWSLVALVLFLLLSEGRSRYIYLDVPFVILLAGLAVQHAAVRLRTIRARTTGAARTPAEAA